LASMANVGLAAVSRFPYAMARDGLIPPIFTKTLENGAPWFNIIMTSVTMAIIFLTLDVAKIAKLGSSFKLLIFGLVMVVVIVYRTTDPTFEHYQPGFKAPFYPYLQLFGISCEIILLYFMGVIGFVVVAVFVVLGFIMYLIYGQYHAVFLGIVTPERCFGILPMKFRTYEVFRREMLQVRKNPLFHYDQEGAESLKSNTVQADYQKQHECLKTGKSKGLYINRVCLTGGPCANKYQGLMYMIKAMTKAGYDCYAVPSVIHTLQNGGCAIPPREDIKNLQIFYVQVINMQVAMERSFTKIAQESNRPSILITDRGALDIKGFFPECWDQIVDKTEFTEEYLMNRYDIVIHLQTTARGLEQFYNDPVFTRGNAIDIDTNLEQAWQGHHNHKIVGNDKGLDHKLQEATAHVLNLLSRAGDKNLKRRMSTMLKGDKEIEAILSTLPNHEGSFCAGNRILPLSDAQPTHLGPRRPSDGAFDGLATRSSGQQRLSGVYERRPSDLAVLKERLSQKQINIESFVEEVALKAANDEDSSDEIQIGKAGVSEKVDHVDQISFGSGADTGI